MKSCGQIVLPTFGIWAGDDNPTKPKKAVLVSPVEGRQTSSAILISDGGSPIAVWASPREPAGHDRSPLKYV